MAENKDIRASRVHPILKSRGAQIATNISSVTGGAPYIEERLHRHASESEASWSGKSMVPGLNLSGAVGRKDRAYLPAYARRISNKIQQYVFGQPIAREGIDEDFKQDADRCGCPLQNIMAELSQMLDAGGWGWIQVDRDPLPTNQEGAPVARSVFDREKNRDRVYWKIWSPVDVVDWCVDAAGRILWLLTQGEVFDNADPAKPATCTKIRTLYVPGGGARLFLKENDPEQVERVDPFTNSAKEVPFILVGCPSEKPIIWDDIERIQSALLNLGSCHHENLVQTVYPQRIVPSDLPSQIASAAGVSQAEGYQMVVGLNAPILESPESKGVTRFIMPPADGIAAIPLEMERLARELFQLVGMMLAKDTKQAESAEAKAWDRLDPQAVLAARSSTLEEAEKRAIAVSKQLDSGFKEYEPKYPRAFDIGDVKADFEALLSLDTMESTETMKREKMRAAAHLLGKIRTIDPKTAKQIEGEIIAHDFSGGMDGMLVDAASGAGQTVADSAMNGAQVASLVEIAVQAASKGLPIETAKQIAAAAFPAIDPQELDAIFKPLFSFTPAAPPAPIPFGG